MEEGLSISNFEFKSDNKFRNTIKYISPKRMGSINEDIRSMGSIILSSDLTKKEPYFRSFSLKTSP